MLIVILFLHLSFFFILLNNNRLNLIFKLEIFKLLIMCTNYRKRYILILNIVLINIYLLFRISKIIIY
jgi:hypothetical protein